VLSVVKFVQREVRSEDGHSGVNKNLGGGSADTARNSLRTTDEYD
jgi:hypothetical protein